MTTDAPSALALFRHGLAVLLDWLGLILLVWLAYQIMFGGSRPFVDTAFAVGGVGAIACLVATGSRRSTPAALIVYVVVAVVSSVTNSEWIDRSGPWSELPEAMRPAMHLVKMAVIVFGAAYLLRTPRRLAWSILLFALAIAVIAAQLCYDRTVTAYVYEEAGSTSLPSVWQWGGMHQIGLLLVLGFPLVVAPAIARPTPTRLAASSIAGGALFLAAVLTGSRSGILSMLLTAVAMPLAAALASHSPRRWRTGAIAVASAAVILAAGATIFFSSPNIRPIQSLSGGRAPIWRAATQIAIDHPGLGVGPGNYMRAMVMDGYAKRFLPDYPAFSGMEQAHNWFLQVASETGFLGLASFGWLAAWLVVQTGRGMNGPHLRIMSYGLCFVLFALFVRSMFDSFLDGLLTTERTRPLVWLIFAAALARARLSPPRPAS